MPEPLPIAEFVQRLKALLEQLPDDRSIATLSPTRLKQLRNELERIIGDIQGFVRKLDPIQPPGFIFDPSDPKVIGQLIAHTMLLQPRIPLATVGRFYGSGVYALYYRGDFATYAPISGTKHPIYVGKADP